jgi:hypothetical protein
VLVVKVELHSAITGKIKPLAQMIIANTGGTEKRGNYVVKIAHQRQIGDLRSNWHEPQREGIVENYPRVSYHVWRLVLRALRSTYPQEN